MPRGGRGGSSGGRGAKRSHKGQRRHFTDEDDMKNHIEKVEREKQWRKQRGMESDEDGEGESKAEKDDSESEETDSDDEKHKGVEHLIEVSNPNRQAGRTTKKVTEMDGTGAASLSRREREELEKQQAKVRYQQLHMQGKTDEAQADLARLALIKKQREENAKKRDEEKKAKEKETAEKNAKKGKS